MTILNQIFRIYLNKLQNTNHRFYSDILPSSEIVIIKKNNKNVNLKKEVAEANNIYKKSKEFRVNEVNIQMISKNIYEQLFKDPSHSVDPQVIQR